jgi:hypothetical protein
MLNTLRQEFASIVFGLIESNDPLDVPLFEYLAIVVRSEPGSLSRLSSVDRAHKCREFPRNDPIYISVLHSLIILVFFDIEGLEVVPFESDAMFETL